MMRSLFCCCALIFVAACARESGAPPDAAGLTATSTEAVRKPFEQLSSNLFTTLEAEAKSRVDGTPRIEDVVAALRKAGVEMSDPVQSLASAVRAKYCATSISKNGTGFSMCEYADEHALAVGREIAEKGYKIANRTFLQNKKTMMVLNATADNETTKKEKQIIADTFAKF